MHLLNVAGQEVPIRIISEWRNNTRISLGKNYVILRIPKSLWSDQTTKNLDWAEKWLRQLIAQKPDALRRYATFKTYQQGTSIHIGGETFTLSISNVSGDTARIKKLPDNVLATHIPSGEGLDQQKVIKKLLVKFFCKYFLSSLKQRVAFLNEKHLGQHYEDVKLKYNTSNWGSCSHGRNLNFSVRLFFAPPQVLDYVIIHELAHLVEMNHSNKFWKIVSDIMPEYKQWENHLKSHSHKYDF